MGKVKRVRIPIGAEREIKRCLATDMRITPEAVAGILEKHGVRGDEKKLQRSYLLRVAQQYMAMLRDDEENRIVYCIRTSKGKKEYVVISCHNDSKQLESVLKRLGSDRKGFADSQDIIRQRLGQLQVVQRQLR